MPKDYAEVDREILEAIQSYEGIPSIRNLSKAGGGPLKYSCSAICVRLKKNPALRETQESRGIWFVENCSRQTFDGCVTTNPWNNLPEKITEAIDRRLDGFILEAIRSYEGIPTAAGLSKEGGGPLEYSNRPILARLKENPMLQEELESRGIWFVENCSRETFDGCITTLQWNGVGRKVREAINRRLDGFILEAITTFNGTPNPFSLCKKGGGPLEYCRLNIVERLKENPMLQEALEARGIWFAENCDRETFDKCATTAKWSSIPGKVREAINRRLDGFILGAIQKYEGIPTAHNLSKEGGGPLEYSHISIAERLKKNPALQEALEARGIWFAENCDRETFDKCVTTTQWNTISEKINEAIDKRLDGFILEAIRACRGVPSARNLSKVGGGPLEYGPHVILLRLEKNPALQEALEARGIWFAENCDRKMFVMCVTTMKWSSIPGKMREAINRRLDGFILEAIQSYGGVSNAINLSKKGGGPLEYSRITIRKRLNKNPDLRKAFYLKRGLTEDRINALEIEQENPSPALVDSIKRRLPNTRVFREALGILKQFRDVFEGKSTMETSFYPEPLGRAARMLGLQLSAVYGRAHGLRRPDFRFEGESRFDSIAMLQCCHRLDPEPLINAFNEANRILVESGTLLISLPHEYSRTPAFAEQVQSFGFELKSEGTLYTRTLSVDELAQLGVEDPERLKQKMEQATNIIQLVKTMPAIGKELDVFVPAKALNGNGEFIPSFDEVDTPHELLLELSAAFMNRINGAGRAFMLTVLNDTDYRQRHLIGYDMNSKQPKTIEVFSKFRFRRPDSAELIAVCGKLHDPSFREKALIRPGHETRVPARLVRRALAGA